MLALKKILHALYEKSLTTGYTCERITEPLKEHGGGKTFARSHNTFARSRKMSQGHPELHTLIA